MKKDAKGAGPQVVTANALESGLVVFRAPDGRWVRAIDEAQLVRGREEAAVLLDAATADAARNIVVEPYLVDVREEDGRIMPVLLREAIRAAGGPTIVEVSAYLHAAAI
ncbi:DUF2849 domain-containing protein [Chelatococcus sp. SYSU_G07232]|uniref:DUF2849 domain-containing protein n=1 Tax=Chelatococcus albus TaxID=3047466 RepID=A0ABT7AFP4_9HYPH|nr:DUF2849 domain-containing protein [Chelatococcus sp. SYSU_G07232]MDJ1158153.1 DUF2849 domain-containing protein [Chelatococcus sp. SYSU_G07232]